MKLIERKIQFPSDIFFFLLYGVYAFAIAPKIVSLVKFGEKNIWVGVLGVAIYILEIFAFKFKLNTIRLDAENKRVEMSKNTDKPVLLPKAGPIIWLSMILKVVFRVGIVIISLLSFGIPAGIGNEDMSPFAIIVLVASVLLEAVLFGYFYLTCPFFNIYSFSTQEKYAEIEESNKWLARIKASYDPEKYFKLEFLSDIILNLFAFMLFSAWWNYINDYGIKIIVENKEKFLPASHTAFDVFPMLIAESLVALIPLRIAYWIEGSVVSYTSKTKWKVRLAFLFAVFMTILPTIQKFLEVY